MEYIAAPWRKDYVRNVFDMKKCIFCEALKKKNDTKAYILYRGIHNFIILNKFPYNPGHLMIAPYEHLDTFEKAQKESSEEAMRLTQLTLTKLRQHYRPQGFNIGMNIGQSGGAGVIDHYHLHIIPRWIGDSNFMPLVGQTKVILESLDQTHKKLFSLFQEAQKA